jgi:hypothetical protein
LVSLLLLAVALLWAPASSAATPADTAATLAYLQANYQLDLAIANNAAASSAASASLATQLGSECQGVLAGAPNEEVSSSNPGEHPTPRARGEHQRSKQQLRTIEAELEQAIEAATYQPDIPAIEAFAAQIAPLSWSDPRIAPLAAFRVKRQKEILTPPGASVCADMKFWAHSGYHALSASSRTFEEAQTARTVTAPEGSVQQLLKPFEQAPERALIKKIEALQQRPANALAGAVSAYSRLQRTLGVPESPFETRKQEPVLGHGRTHAGSTFTLRRENATEPSEASCRKSISIEIEGPSKRKTGVSEVWGTSLCLSGRKRRSRASGSCGNEVTSIVAVMPASVQSVQLLLSNGKTITSGVIHIPPRDGGPASVYVQAVRGYSPYPVSLRELGRDDKLVVMVKVGFRCHPEPPASGPRFVSLVNGTTPTGEPFAIEGVLVHFGNHQTGFSLDLSHSHSSNSEAEGEIAVGHTKPKAFSWSLGMECPPHEYAIVYGILSAPGSTVMARTSTGLVPLTKVELAADLHSGGPLVYGVFSTLPSELVVLGGNGTTLYTESLVAKGNEEAEYCGGYAEG